MMSNSENERINFAKRLNKILDDRHYPERGRAQKLLNELNLDISDRAVNKWLKGETMPDRANMVAIAKLFDLSYDWLASGADSKKPSIDDLRREIERIENSGVFSDDDMLRIKDVIAVSMPVNDVPLISWVAAGSWTGVEPVTLADATAYYPRPKNLSKDGFALKVRGRSMWPDFKPGEIIFVEPNVSVWGLNDGDLVVVSCNNDTEATFKQLVLGETAEDMYLKPLNPDWPEQRMQPMDECTLVGKVVGRFTEF